MARLLRFAAIAAAANLVVILWSGSIGETSAKDDANSGKTAEPSSKSGHRYPDFGFLPAPSEYEGRVFELSQSYPASKPGDEHVPEIAVRDFHTVKSNWKDYLLDVRSYCFRDNIGANDVEDDWRVEKDSKWFHMPWQHFGPNGREGIHGLTKEAPVQPRQLAWTQTYSTGQTYAIAFYNEFGGYTIGQVWKNPEHPGQEQKSGSNNWTNMQILFPVGTVVCKLLFVDVPPEQVPFLNPPLKWSGYITENFQSTKRTIRPLSLIQMDVMVRHKSAPNGWLFGTFQYNGNRAGVNPQPSWDNLVPVGLQWGNDFDIRGNASNPQPVATMRNLKLAECAINDSADLPPTHLGWNGRLNGPVDNAMSTCMSCHMTAESPQRSPNSPMFLHDIPTPGSDKWMEWFKNKKCGDKFDSNAQSTDFSLQLAIALQNFRTWRDEGSKMLASRYKHRQVPARIKAATPIAPLRPLSDVDDPDVDIRRGVPPQ